MTTCDLCMPSTRGFPMSAFPQRELTTPEIQAAMDGSLHLSPGWRVDAFLPSPMVQNHAANLHFLPDGGLACVWFGGTMEGMGDISIYISTLGPGGWSPARRLSDDPSRSEQNPVLFNAPTGAVCAPPPPRGCFRGLLRPPAPAAGSGRGVALARFPLRDARRWPLDRGYRQRGHAGLARCRAVLAGDRGARKPGRRPYEPGFPPGWHTARLLPRPLCGRGQAQPVARWRPDLVRARAHDPAQ